MSRTIADKVLAGRPESVSEARAWTARHLDGFPGVDEALLCTSEMVTNGILHSRSKLDGGKVRIRVEAVPGAYLRIEVRDDGPGFDPARTVRAAGLDENGRGLFLVSQLAGLWGTDGHGMCWCRFTWPVTVPGPAQGADDGALFALPAGGAR
jgi:anti-sigma regulatory factor (Ser/Thr protein kinase)